MDCSNVKLNVLLKYILYRLAWAWTHDSKIMSLQYLSLSHMSPYFLLYINQKFYLYEHRIVLSHRFVQQCVHRFWIGKHSGMFNSKCYCKHTRSTMVTIVRLFTLQYSRWLSKDKVFKKCFNKFWNKHAFLFIFHSKCMRSVWKGIEW